MNYPDLIKWIFEFVYEHFGALFRRLKKKS